MPSLSFSSRTYCLHVSGDGFSCTSQFVLLENLSQPFSTEYKRTLGRLLCVNPSKKAEPSYEQRVRNYGFRVDSWRYGPTIGNKYVKTSELFEHAYPSCGVNFNSRFIVGAGVKKINPLTLSLILRKGQKHRRDFTKKY